MYLMLAFYSTLLKDPAEGFWKCINTELTK